MPDEARIRAKVLYQAYREAAIAFPGPATVAPTANVLMTEGGAFVEATVWVPRWNVRLVEQRMSNGEYFAIAQSLVARDPREHNG